MQYIELNIAQEINSLHAELGRITVRLEGYGNARPRKSVLNNTAWEYWYSQQSPEVKQAEHTLRRIGYYNHEGCRTMKDCLDINGKQIHVDDVGEWRKLDGDVVPAMVTCIFSPGEIQINPLGEGLPELIIPSEFCVTHSYLDKIRKLATIEELQAILLNAETRCKQELQERSKISKSKDTSASSPSTRVKSKPSSPSVEEDL